MTFPFPQKQPKWLPVVTFPYLRIYRIPIWKKFGRQMQKNMQMTTKWRKSKPEVEFQSGSCFVIETGTSYISHGRDTSPKFGLHVNFDLPK